MSDHPAALLNDATLAEVADAAATCVMCKLAGQRTQVVFGVGDPHADLMFVGEGPGKDEDEQGEPFVGRAGKLLTQLIEGIGFTRNDVYIANVVKCRPPGNRDPEPDEIEACAPWLDRQINLIKPRLVVTLGNPATKSLLQTKDGITKLHGQEFPFSRAGHEAVLIPTLHPSYVLRSGGKTLAESRADFVHIKRTLARLDMIATITARDAAETQSIAAALGRMLRAGDLVVLSGDLGAGKTTFVQGVARALGVDEPVTSPTFTIVQEYDATIPIAHIDVYRLHRIQELHDLGFEEMLEDRIVLIEWGEMVVPVLPRDRVDVHLEMDDDPDTRLITIDAHGPQWADRVLALGRDLMLLLGIDTATRRVGVVLADEQGMLGRVELGGPSAAGPPRHAETLAPAIKWCMEQCNVEPAQLSAVAVGIGPGMFTGLRVGVTTAKVLAQSLRIPVIPVPSLDLLAYPLRHARGLVVATIDARRHELYWAIYQPVQGGVQRVSEYELGDPAELVAELEARGQDAILCGDGVLHFPDVFTPMGRRAEIAGPAHASPSLAALAELARARYEREDFCAPDQVLPMYLRQSDAEIQWDRKAG